MKKILCACLVAMSASSAMADLVVEVTDGQVLAVTGWKDMMPKLVVPGLPASSSQGGGTLTVKFAAMSNGCTDADSYNVELKKLDETTYVVSAIRTKPDFCESLMHDITLMKSVPAPIEVFNDVGSGKARILTAPYVSVGVAH